MSFVSLKKDEIVEAARFFGVDFEEDATKPMLIKALGDEGVTWDMYKENFPDPEPEEELPDQEVGDAPVSNEPEAVDDAPKNGKKSETVLVKMTRANPVYEVRGYRFTKKHPFLPVSAEDADWLVENEEGFRFAKTSEVESFYS